MGLPLLLTSSLFADLPSLNDKEITALASVQDSGDVPDRAFGVMVEHITRENIIEHNEPIRLRVPVSTLLATPSATRGALYRVEGQCVERRRMPSPHSEVEEWFLRLPTGEPVAVYLPVGHANSMEPEGRPISIDARFYKVIEAIARDGQVRKYPAFFGRSPRLLAETRAMAMERMDVLVLLGFLILLLIVTCAVMAFARKQRRPRARLSRSLVDPEANMPDDPAVALRELRARGERSQS